VSQLRTYKAPCREPLALRTSLTSSNDIECAKRAILIREGRKYRPMAGWNVFPLLLEVVEALHLQHVSRLNWDTCGTRDEGGRLYECGKPIIHVPSGRGESVQTEQGQ
jgi:hypothetical protein